MFVFDIIGVFCVPTPRNKNGGREVFVSSILTAAAVLARILGFHSGSCLSSFCFVFVYLLFYLSILFPLSFQLYL